jgi:formylglycine-generating enzyme required for sulfatase activity
MNFQPMMNRQATENKVLAEVKSPPADQPSDLGLRAGAPLTLDLGSGVKLELAWIPPGEFMMGSPGSEKGRFEDESPQHPVRLSKGFWMGKFEVTQEQWERMMGGNPSIFKNARSPVENVSWDECQEFLNKMNASVPAQGLKRDDGNKFRLPSEAEWEYACRAGTSARFNLGDADGDLDQAGWYSGNSGNSTHPVGEKQANAWGLFDMNGNVMEWCQDWYGPYAGGAVTDPGGPWMGPTASRVLRGGSWFNASGFCRSAYRSHSAPLFRFSRIGFRVVCFQ